GPLQHRGDGSRLQRAGFSPGEDAFARSRAPLTVGAVRVPGLCLGPVAGREGRPARAAASGRASEEIAVEPVPDGTALSQTPDGFTTGLDRTSGPQNLRVSQQRYIMSSVLNTESSRCFQKLFALKWIILRLRIQASLSKARVFAALGCHSERSE